MKHSPVPVVLKESGAFITIHYYLSHQPSYIIAPMHEAVPSAVSAAVKMDITT